MTTKATISINQKIDDLDYKKMIKNLIKYKSKDNPYFRRSESDVVKMLIEDPLIDATKKFLPQKKKSK